MSVVADYSKWISIQIRDSRKDTFVSLLFISALQEVICRVYVLFTLLLSMFVLNEHPEWLLLFHS